MLDAGCWWLGRLLVYHREFSYVYIVPVEREDVGAESVSLHGVFVAFEYKVVSSLFNHTGAVRILYYVYVVEEVSL